MIRICNEHKGEAAGCKHTVNSNYYNYYWFHISIIKAIMENYVMYNY